MEEWVIVLISVIISTIGTIIVALITYVSSKKNITSQLKADIQRIQEQIKEEAKKEVILQKQKTYEDVVFFLSKLFRTETEPKDKLEDVQLEMHRIASRIYVYSPDNVVRRMKDLLNASPDEKDKMLRKLVLEIRKDIFGKTELKSDDIVPMVIHQRKNPIN